MAILPLDFLAVEILPRLRPKTLLRFKYVNKYFYNHISSKNIIVFGARKDGQQCLYFLDINVPDSGARYLPLPPSSSKCSFLDIVGSCHGLLCVRSYNLSTSYWMILNPATGKISTNISVSCFTSFTSFTSDLPRKLACCGFGYDVLNDDYKLVDVQLSIYNGIRKVNVYSTKANSWRLIKNMNFPTSKLGNSLIPQKCVIVGDYLMHWFLTCSMLIDRHIICFNAITEQWTPDIALPNIDLFYYCYVQLGVLNGCLCLLDNIPGRKFQGWIMKEYGVQTSWTKFISIDDPPCFNYFPIISVERGVLEKILSVKWESKSNPPRIDETYQWFNIRNKTIKKLELIGAPCGLEVLHLCLGSAVTSCDEVRLKIDDQFRIVQANHYMAK